MIVEERMYTPHVGKVPAFMGHYEHTRSMKPLAFFEKILREMIQSCPKQA
jgi:hypothetical protein